MTPEQSGKTGFRNLVRYSHQSLGFLFDQPLLSLSQVYRGLRRHASAPYVLPHDQNPELRDVRYSRHGEFVSGKEQEQLHQANILLAGCGAGSSLAPHLARYGYSTKGMLTL